MVSTHGNVIFDILEHSAFQKYSICWFFRSLSCSNHLYMYLALQFFPLITHVLGELKNCASNYSPSETLNSPFHASLVVRFASRSVQFVHQCGQNVELRAEMQFKWQNLEKWKIPRNRGRASFRILFAQLKRCLFIGQLLTNKPSNFFGHHRRM